MLTRVPVAGTTPDEQHSQTTKPTCMKKLFYIFGLLWSCAYLLPLSATAAPDLGADTINCDIVPKFEWVRDSANCKKIRFINLTAPTTTNAHFIWKFGDGTSSNEYSPTHIYANEGVYTVCLIVETSNGCRKEVCKQVEVRCQAPCNLEAKFEFKKDTINPLKIYFINQTVVPTAAGVQYLWTFGDGSSSTDRNPIHTYAAPGTYVVCLKVMVSNTCVSSVCKTLVLQNIPPPPPPCNVQAKFEWRRDSANAHKIWFQNLSQPIQNIWKTSWTYGDGTSSQDFNSFHVYQQPGVYKVCLKVVSLSGCVREYCQEVRVGTPCDDVRVKFEYRRDSLKPYKISFFAVSNVPLVHQRWVITRQTPTPDISVIITQNNPTYSFSDSGWYLVCLHAITSTNCKKTYCERIYIEKGANGRLNTQSISNIPVYPNPARSTVRLEVNMELSTVLQMRVLDGTGSPKMEFKTAVYSGNNHIVIPVEKLSSGFYVVEIRYGNTIKLAKFQKS